MLLKAVQILFNNRRLTYIIAAALIVFLMSLTFRPKLVADARLNAYEQVFGQRYSAGGYWGVSAYQKTLDPGPLTSGLFVDGAVGLSTSNHSNYIESGPSKACDLDCGLHPYGYYTKSGTTGIRIDTSIWLAANGSYQYQTNYVGSNNWNAIFCSGAGCASMITGNMGTNTLPYVYAGAESNIGWGGGYQTSSAKYKPYNTASWYAWCYTSSYIVSIDPSAHLTSCVSYAWEAVD
jgi:hypothetical protein